MSSENDDARVGIYGSKKALAEGERNELIHGLGLVSVEFQALETLIKSAIGDLVAKDEIVIGALITAELSFKAASHLLYALAEYRWNDSDAAQVLDDILRRCEIAEGKRNQLIHSHWHLETAKGAVRFEWTLRNRKGLHLHNEQITPTDMKNLAEELKDCRHDLAGLLANEMPDVWWNLLLAGYEPHQPPPLPR